MTLSNILTLILIVLIVASWVIDYRFNKKRKVFLKEYRKLNAEQKQLNKEFDASCRRYIEALNDLYVGKQI